MVLCERRVAKSTSRRRSRSNDFHFGFAPVDGEKPSFSRFSPRKTRQQVTRDDVSVRHESANAVKIIFLLFVRDKLFCKSENL